MAISGSTIDSRINQWKNKSAKPTCHEPGAVFLSGEGLDERKKKNDYGNLTIIAIGVGVAGLEPTTSASRTQHSTN